MERSVVEQQLFVEDTQNSNEFHHFFHVKKENFNKKWRWCWVFRLRLIWIHTRWMGWRTSDSGDVHHHPSYLVAKERRRVIHVSNVCTSLIPARGPASRGSRWLPVSLCCAWAISTAKRKRNGIATAHLLQIHKLYYVLYTQKYSPFIFIFRFLEQTDGGATTRRL